MYRSHRQALCRITFACLAALGSLTAGASPGAPPIATPIKHLIVVIGENHTFDNLFGGFVPAEGQKVFNLLSQGIINRDGTPGPNFLLAVQQQAGNTSL